MSKSTEEALHQLRVYMEEADFKGYDPYDTLNSFLPFRICGKWLPIFAIQFQKRNPVNIRPLLGIKRGINPKAMGLLLEGYCTLYQLDAKPEYKTQIDYIFDWLSKNYTKGYSGYCWGYNFDWASPVKYLKAHTPTIVVTSFVAKGLFKYYELFREEKALEILKGVCDFIMKDLPVSENEHGICFSYSPGMKDCCYNANMLGAEVLAKVHSVTDEQPLLAQAVKAVDFTLAYQKDDGHWNYSIDLLSGKERKQIDFHQGFILNSFYDFIKYSDTTEEKYIRAVEKGAAYYRDKQFFFSGQSKWRVPKDYPVDIHNQSQGIITFAKLKDVNFAYADFAQTIAEWTIENMHNKNGSFSYRKNRMFTNRIPYMRWAQAWMFLALIELAQTEKAVQ